MLQSLQATELVVVKDAVFGYEGKAVVRVNELRLRHGRCLGIFGPNGSGKTTLIRGITGLLSPMSGSVNRAATAVGVRFGYLPQYRGIDVSWPMSGFDAAAIATSARARLGRVSHAARHKIHDAMRRLDVEPLSRRSFGKLSGGQQQRLLLAGALAAEPHVLVLDEPTDGLDVRSRGNLLELLRSLAHDGLSTAIISHDIEDLIAVCDEVAWLHAADVAGDPSRVEIITPSTLAERILSTRPTP
jgi:ABC-type Mn2+/Zn2+ transport system ATPase subunit